MRRRRQVPMGLGPFLFAVALATLVPTVGLSLLRSGEPDTDARARSPRPTSTAAASPPELSFEPPPGAAQAARWLDVRFTSTKALDGVTLQISPDPALACSARLESARRGRVSCDGLLAPSTRYVATLTVTAGEGPSDVTYAFNTMGDRLQDVRWFTEFENPSGDPLACAAASCRIIQLFATGQDRLTAEQILTLGRQFNRSLDPGIDPAAIAEVLHRLDPRNRYHYYRFATREEATRASVRWLLHSGKPVIAITLAGQHAPLIIGYTGTVDRIAGVVVMDPQRGDLDPRTANRRPDKYRSEAFQTGAVISLEEWYRDEWWFGFPYAPVIQHAGRMLNVERNDGAYPLPHWGGQFVILVDDGDADNPPDGEGRVQFR